MKRHHDWRSCSSRFMSCRWCYREPRVVDVHYVRLGDFKLPAEPSPGRRVPKRKSQPHSRFNASDWVWYYVLRHSVTRGAEETGIYGHNRVFATSLAVGVVNLKDVHGRELQVLVLGTAVSVGARNQVHLCVGPSAEADLMGRRAQQSTEPLADHDVYLVWSSRRRIVYMSAGLATVIRPGVPAGGRLRVAGGFGVSSPNPIRG